MVLACAALACACGSIELLLARRIVRRLASISRARKPEKLRAALGSAYEAGAASALG